MKECATCDATLQASSFGINRRNDDGLMRDCKACARRKLIERGAMKPDGWIRKTADLPAYQRQWRAENAEKCRGYEKNRTDRTPSYYRERHIQRMRKLHGGSWVPGRRATPAKTPEEKRELGRLRMLRRRESVEGRLKWRARKRLQTTVKRGRIQKLPCWTCGAARVEGHHPDYSQPLAVVWLCPDHHREVHALA